MRFLLVLLFGGFLLPLSAQDKKEKSNDLFEWKLKKDQKLDVTLKVNYKAPREFLVLSAKGTVTITSAKKGSAGGTWEISSISSHHKFLHESKFSWSGGKVAVDCVVTSGFDEKDRAETSESEIKRLREFMEKWVKEGHSAHVQFSSSGMQVSRTGSLPGHLKNVFQGGCWDIASPITKDKRTIEVPVKRTWFLFSGLKFAENEGTGKWTGQGAKPAYEEKGTVKARYTVDADLRMRESLTFSRKTKADRTKGYVTEVKETFSYESTANGRPGESRKGTFTLKIKLK